MSKLPKRIARYFWGDDVSELSWEKHKDYIAKTLLEKGDTEAIRWLLKRVDKPYLKNIVKSARFEPKAKNFWEVYLS